MGAFYESTSGIVDPSAVAAVTCAASTPVDEYIAPVSAVYAATAPVNEYVTGMVSSQNMLPLIRTWVRSRNCAWNFVMRPKLQN